MQISFVMLIFLLFSDQISGGGKSLQGELPQGGEAPPVEESQSSEIVGLHFCSNMKVRTRPAILKNCVQIVTVSNFMMSH